jgi:hypothetical protein
VSCTCSYQARVPKEVDFVSELSAGRTDVL